MKKSFLLLCLFLQAASIVAQDANPDLLRLRALNAQTVEKYKANELNDALRSSKEALAISVKLFGENNLETATCYRNLGEIYRAKLEWRSAAENFQRTLEIYKQLNVVNTTGGRQLLDSLGVVLALDGRKAEAEAILLQNVAEAQKRYGEHSPQIEEPPATLSSFYAYTRAFDKADAIFVRRGVVRRVLSQLDKVPKDARNLSHDQACYLASNFGLDEERKRAKSISDAVEREFEKFKKPQPDKPAPSLINGGVVNGRAIRLVKPPYPAGARSAGARGTVLVQVLIDEEGKVVTAEAFCGDHLLRKASEEAAMNSKFSPTRLGSNPVKVNGIISYHYVP